MQPRNAEESDRREAGRPENHHPAPPLVPPLPPVQTAPGVGNLTADEAAIWTLEHTPYTWQQMVYTNYSYGIERDEKKLKENDQDHRKWTNPLEIQLRRPVSLIRETRQLTVSCPQAAERPRYENFLLVWTWEGDRGTFQSQASGSRVSTFARFHQRSYWYARGEYESDDIMADAMEAVCMNQTECDTKGMTPRSPLDLPLSRQTWIDVLVNQETVTPKVCPREPLSRIEPSC